LLAAALGPTMLSSSTSVVFLAVLLVTSSNALPIESRLSSVDLVDEAKVAKQVAMHRREAGNEVRSTLVLC